MMRRSIKFTVINVMCINLNVLLLSCCLYRAEAFVIDVATDLLLPLPTVAVSLFGTKGNRGFPVNVVIATTRTNEHAE